MRIGIDAYPLTREKFTGLGAYLLNLVKELQIIDALHHPEHILQALEGRHVGTIIYKGP